MKRNEYINTFLTAPDGVVWEGQSLTVSSENSEGIFDLYPDHARFMTLLEDVDLVIRLEEDQEEVFHIEKAVLLFENSTAKVYLHKHIDPKSN